MARKNVSGQRLALRCDQGLLEGDALVPWQNRLSNPDESIAVSHRRGDVRDLVASWFPLFRRATEPLKGFEKEGLDVVRLEPTRFGSFHVLADAVDTTRVHRIVCQSSLFEQILNLCPVEGIGYHLREPTSHLRLFAVADGFNQQFTQRTPLELQLPENIEDLATQRLSRLLQLLEQRPVDLSLSGAFCDQIPEVAHFSLADAVDATESLLNAIRIPWQVVVDHQVRALQIDAFARGIGSYQNLHFFAVGKTLLSVLAVLAAHASVNVHHSFRLAQEPADSLGEVAQGVAMFREDNELLRGRRSRPRQRQLPRTSPLQRQQPAERRRRSHSEDSPAPPFAVLATPPHNEC
jgi:hypothetical protein